MHTQHSSPERVWNAQTRHIPHRLKRGSGRGPQRLSPVIRGPFCRHQSARLSPKPLMRDPTQPWEAGSGGAGQDHKTRDVISFCKGRLLPKRGVDLPGAPPEPSRQGRGSRRTVPRRVIPTPTVTHTPTRVLYTRPCTRPCIRSPRGTLHAFPVHTRTRVCLPHATPSSIPLPGSSKRPRALPAHAKEAPSGRCTGVLSSRGLPAEAGSLAAC